jgi:hypothetical protein
MQEEKNRNKKQIPEKQEWSRFHSRWGNQELLGLIKLQK